MSEAYNALRRCYELGIHLQVHGDRLIYRPASAMPDDLREELARHKSEVMDIIRREYCPPPSRYAKEFAKLISMIPDPARRAELRSRFEGRTTVFGQAHRLPLDEAERLALEGLKRELEMTSGLTQRGANGDRRAGPITD